MAGRLSRGLMIFPRCACRVADCWRSRFARDRGRPRWCWPPAAIRSPPIGRSSFGALAPENLPNTLSWATPLVGMTLAAAIPLRGGMVNLGGDGQLVVGGLVAALVPLHLAGARLPAVAAFAIALAMLAAGLYAALAAWGEVRHGVPMLISSLLLSYPAVGLASYLVGFPLRDRSSGLPQTPMIPPARAPAAARRRAERRRVRDSRRCHRGRRVRPAQRRRLRTADARDERTVCALWRRRARAAGRRDDVRERRHRRADRRRSSCSARSSASSTARWSRRTTPGRG